MSRKLPISDFAERHPGVTVGIGLSFEEAARVCLDRHYRSPISFSARDNENAHELDAEWIPADAVLSNAWANAIDTTEAGACALALASFELLRGLVAVRRAETFTGADYYMDKAGTSPGDLETAIRLEISGMSEGTSADLELRLRRKLEQTAAGKSNLPAAAIVVGFRQLRILSADMRDS